MDYVIVYNQYSTKDENMVLESFDNLKEKIKKPKYIRFGILLLKIVNLIREIE